jgi:hypothetical protein
MLEHPCEYYTKTMECRARHVGINLNDINAAYASGVQTTYTAAKANIMRWVIEGPDEEEG